MPKTKLSRKKNIRLECKTLNSADHITTVGKGVRDLLSVKTDKPVSIIYNGFREIDSSPLDTKKFEIMHLGNLSNMQYVDTLFEALGRLKPSEQLDIKLTFIGSVAEEHKLKIALLENIEFEYIDFLPYDDMIQRARQASMLLLSKLDSSYSKGLISAKIFDYLALRRPIIAVTDLGSDIADILNVTSSGKAFLPNEYLETAHYISNCLNDWQQNGQTIFERSEALKEFSMEYNCISLTEIFQKTGKNN